MEREEVAAMCMHGWTACAPESIVNEKSNPHPAENITVLTDRQNQSFS